MRYLKITGAGVLITLLAAYPAWAQAVPKLKSAFVFSNGGVVHWHEAVDFGSELMADLASGQNSDNHPFAMVETARQTDITDSALQGHDVLVLNNVSEIGRLLNDSQKQAIENFVYMGGGVAGWHGTIDKYFDVDAWPWFSEWIGARFAGSASWNPATIYRTPESHQGNWDYITSHFSDTTEMIAEEWLQFAEPHPMENPHNKILLLVDPDDVNSQQSHLPQAWINETQRTGKLFITTFGNMEAMYQRPDIIDLFYKGIVYAAGGYEYTYPAISYSEGHVLKYEVNKPITPNILIYEEDFHIATVSPRLPEGLFIEPTFAHIMGTPTVVTPATDYVVTVASKMIHRSVVLNIEITGITQTRVESPEFFKSSASPNPFTINTSISFTQIQPSGNISLGVFDLRGNRVRKINKYKVYPGFISAEWDGTGDEGQVLPQGMYIARVISDNKTSTLMLSLLR